jgi:hypothetical protein
MKIVEVLEQHARAPLRFGNLNVNDGLGNHQFVQETVPLVATRGCLPSLWCGSHVSDAHEGEGHAGWASRPLALTDRAGATTDTCDRICRSRLTMAKRTLLV